MNVSNWIAVASVAVVALAAYIPLRYAARKDERDQERANRDATRRAVSEARAEFDKSKAELIADRDYWRQRAGDLQAQINDMLAGRRRRD